MTCRSHIKLALLIIYNNDHHPQLSSIQFSTSTQFRCQNSSLLNNSVKHKLPSLNKKNSELSKPRYSSIWPIDRTLSGAISQGQSGPGSNGNEGVLHILQSSNITRASPSDCFGSYTGHSLGGLTPLQISSRYILQFQPTGQSRKYNQLNWKISPKRDSKINIYIEWI